MKQAKQFRELYWHVVEPRGVYLLTARYDDGSCETLLPDGVTLDTLCAPGEPPEPARQAHELLGGWLEFEAARRWRQQH